MWMWWQDGEVMLRSDQVMCSGSNGDKGPELALDGDESTAWRPHIHAPKVRPV